jgi:hypothetical protein
MAKAGEGVSGEIGQPTEPSELGDDWLLDLAYKPNQSGISQSDTSQSYASMALSSIRSVFLSLAQFAGGAIYNISSQYFSDAAQNPQLAIDNLRSLCVKVAQDTIHKPEKAVKVMSWVVGLTSGSSLLLICCVELVWDAASRAAVKSITNYYMSKVDWELFQGNKNSDDQDPFVITDATPEKSEKTEVLASYDEDFERDIAGESSAAADET